MIDLKNTKFSKLIILDRKHPVGQGGRQIVVKFKNDFGASIVHFPGSYGYEQGLFEIAVVRFKGDDFNLTYETSVTDDVLGHLTEKDCLKSLSEIEAL